MTPTDGKGRVDPAFPYQIPVERVAVVIENYIEKYCVRAPSVNHGHMHGVEAVANLTGFMPRRIYSILKREYQTVSFETVDKLFIGLQCMELWHMPQGQGGFSDLYECETVQPALPPPTQEQLETRKRQTIQRRAATARKKARAVAA